MANPVVINNGLHVDAVGGVGVTSAQMARSSMAAFVAHDGAGPRLGVFYEGTQQLIGGTSVTSPSMLVSVVPLAFAGSKATAEGVYVARNTGVIYVDVAAAPASNSRIDTVYAMQRDLHSNTSPDGLTQGEIGIITGTAAVSPTAPAAPAGAVVIGTVTVAAGVTATTNAGCTIATTCQWTAAAGASVPCRNQAERDALTAYDGLQVYRLDTHTVETYNGTAWAGLPGGTMGTPTSSSTNGTSTSGATETRDAVLGNYTFTAVAGRRYRVFVDGLVVAPGTVGDLIGARVRNGGASTPTAASTLVASTQVVMTSAGLGVTLANTFVPGAGTVTLSLFLVRASGTGIAQPQNFRELYAVDMGPA
jgi:hypothetical protein